MVDRIKLLYVHDPGVLVAILGGGVATMLTAILNFMNIYVFSDKEFLISLLILMFLHSVQKVRIILKEDAKRKPEDKQFSYKILFNKLKDKIINYAALLITVHVLVHFKVNGETVRALSWIDVTVYTALIAYEGGSIIKSSGKNIRKLLPKSVMDKLLNAQEVEKEIAEEEKEDKKDFDL